MDQNKEINLSVGLRIREIREAHKMTRAEFSERCDISESFLAAVENGKKGITSRTLYKICSVMNVSADYIIRGYGAGFEQDMLIEMISSVNKPFRESLIRIIREYVDVVNSQTR